MKRVGIVIFILLLLMQSVVIASPNEVIMDNYKPPAKPDPNTDFDVFVNGELIEFTKETGYPEFLDGNVMIPVMSISTPLWLRVSPKMNSEQPIITSIKNKIEFYNGSPIAIIDGVETDMGVKYYKKGDKSETKKYIPLRSTIEAFGGKVGYKKVGKRHLIAIEMEVDWNTIPLSEGISDENWIEPEFNYRIPPKRYIGDPYYSVYLTNYDEFEGVDFIVSSRLVGYDNILVYRGQKMLEPGITTYDGRKSYVGLSRETYDELDMWGKIFKLSPLRYKINLHNDDLVTPPKEGELMPISIIFTQNGISKRYSIEVPFTKSEEFE